MADTISPNHISEAYFSIIPANEKERISALNRYKILDTPPDGTFDQITALVAQLLQVPIVIISLVDNDRIWFKSAHGLETQQINRDPGLCASAILSQEAYVISDAKIDPRALTNPLVAGEFGLRFYAAVPLQTSDGYNLGTLCCLDFNPRTFDAQQISILENFTKIVMDEMELRLAAKQVDELHKQLQELHETVRQQAARDSLTGLWNRRSIMEIMQQTLALSKREKRPASVLVLDIDFFKHINDTYGHPAGDKVLISVSHQLQQKLRESDSIGRIGGEEFLCVLYPCDPHQARQVAERCRSAIASTPIEIDPEKTTINPTISIGVYSNEDKYDLSVQDLVKYADDALYESKRGGRDRITVGK